MQRELQWVEDVFGSGCWPHPSVPAGGCMLGACWASLGRLLQLLQCMAAHSAPQLQAIGSTAAASHLLTTTRMLSVTVSEMVGVFVGCGSSGVSSARRSRIAAASWGAQAAECKHAVAIMRGG